MCLHKKTLFEMDLTSLQREILGVLVDSSETASTMTAQDIAEAVDHSPGGIRNTLQTLTALNLIEGIAGPKGGYKPKVDAYTALDKQMIDVDEGEQLVFAHDHHRIDVTVETIDLVNVHDPNNCQAQVTFGKSVQDVTVGDAVIVGPTPHSRLVIAGEVEQVDGTSTQLQLAVTRLTAPFDEKPRTAELSAQ